MFEGKSMKKLYFIVALSGLFASACETEAGPRGSWTEEQEREEKERGRSDYTEPRIRLRRITQGHGPSTQRTRMDNDTGRNKQRICTYECKQIAEQGITTRDGARNNHDEQQATNSEQGGEQMPISVRYDARNRKTGRRCCRTHSGRSSRQQGPPRNLHR